MGEEESDNGIQETLGDVIRDIREGNIEQATVKLSVLQFERLQNPIPDPSKGPGRLAFIDPGGAFGTERVNATGRQITTCRAALSGGDDKAALAAAEKALQYWREH